MADAGPPRLPRRSSPVSREECASSERPEADCHTPLTSFVFMHLHRKGFLGMLAVFHGMGRRRQVRPNTAEHHLGNVASELLANTRSRRWGIAGAAGVAVHALMRR